MIKEAIVKIVNKQDLTYEEAYEVMNEIMSGKRLRRRTLHFLQRCQRKVQELRQPMKLQAVRLQCVSMRYK